MVLNELSSDRTYRGAIQSFQSKRLWDLFDGDRQRLNIASECLDRHRDRGVALRLRRSDGCYETVSFSALSAASARVAHFLEERGVAAAEPVAIMAEPSLLFYAALFGVMKRGAAAVPLYTLFGPQAVSARVRDCAARTLLVDEGCLSATEACSDCDVIVLDDRFADDIAPLPDSYEATTQADDLAVLQYTSGTSKQVPDAVPHRHRAIVSLMSAAIFAIGLADEDRYFCPSSPAWGHGLWHGTIAPWALGIAAGAYAGRFDGAALVDALQHFSIDNLAAAGTVYRMLLRDDLASSLPRLNKMSYTGEALETQAATELWRCVGIPICGMYGTTETGVLIGNFPGYKGYTVRPGALGKPLPGLTLSILDGGGEPRTVGIAGEIAVKRHGRWIRSRDLGTVDEDGYFYYHGRADDVIISAGWTISPVEVEQVILGHPDVDDAAVVGVPDVVRGSAVKAFVVSERNDVALVDEIKDWVRGRLSRHEYPRQVEVIDRLPYTPSGKVNRRELRERS